MERIDSPKYNISIGVVKFSENLRTFSKNLTINTIITNHNFFANFKLWKINLKNSYGILDT